ENVLDELLDLATALADQADDDDVRLGETGHHAQQHRLAHTGAGEQTQTLAAPDGEQAVDAADADIQRFADGVPLERVDHRPVHRHPVFGLHAALAVQRATGTIDDPTEHRGAHRQPTGISQRHHTGARRGAGQAADRHEEKLAAGKTHHFGFDLGRVVAVVVDHQAAAAHRGLQPFGFQRQADHAQQATFEDRLIGQLYRLAVGLQALGEADAFKAHRRCPARYADRRRADWWRSPAAARTTA